jgi:hypothetical protein
MQARGLFVTGTAGHPSRAHGHTREKWRQKPGRAWYSEAGLRQAAALTPWAKEALAKPFLPGKIMLIEEKASYLQCVERIDFAQNDR